MKKLITLGSISILLICLVIIPGCKSGYDITGTWTFTVNTIVWTMTFTGSESSGTTIDTYPYGSGVGTYTVNDSQVTIIVSYAYGPYLVTFSGSFTTDNNMSGTWTEGSDSGTWTAVR